MLPNRADDGEGLVVQPPLPQVVGYVVVVIIGLLIATSTRLFCCSRPTIDNNPVMIFVTRLLKATVNEDNSKTEMFITANRSVRTGLTASAVISVR
jgi:hypothetical protein